MPRNSLIAQTPDLLKEGKYFFFFFFMFQSQNQQQGKQLIYALQERQGREHKQDCPSVTDGNQPFDQLSCNTEMHLYANNMLIFGLVREY